MYLFYLERKVYILYFVISPFSVQRFVFLSVCFSVFVIACLSVCLNMKWNCRFILVVVAVNLLWLQNCVCPFVYKVSRQLTFLCLKENNISLNYQDHATQHQRNFIILCSIFAFYSCKWMIYTEIWYSCGIWHFYECNGYVLLKYSRLGDTLSRYMPE